MEEAKTKEDGQESQDLKLGLSDDGKDSPTAVAPASEVPPDQPTEGPGYLQEGELVEVLHFIAFLLVLMCTLDFSEHVMGKLVHNKK